MRKVFLPFRIGLPLGAVVCRHEELPDEVIISKLSPIKLKVVIFFTEDFVRNKKQMVYHNSHFEGISKKPGPAGWARVLGLFLGPFLGPCFRPFVAIFLDGSR